MPRARKRRGAIPTASAACCASRSPTSCARRASSCPCSRRPRCSTPRSNPPRPIAGTDNDRLRSDLVEGAFAALADEGLEGIRDVGAFERRLEAVGKGLVPEAMARLPQAETIPGLVAGVRARLESQL